jgi:N-acetylmuramoyl-L-alanine amidase
MRKAFIAVWCVLMVYLVFMIGNFYTSAEYTVSYRHGSRGDVVRQIQTKLKAWGYYKASVDGIFGYQTYLSTKSFQRKNGLYPDGVVGAKTLAALGINVKVASNTSTGSQNTHLLSRAISGEARGEPYVGQVAVGAVIMNRVRDSRFPNTIAGVIYQPRAFTAVDDGQINLEATASAKKAASDSLNGWDPSGGAVFYYNPAKSTSKWIFSRPIIKVIGKHYFCK